MADPSTAAATATATAATAATASTAAPTLKAGEVVAIGRMTVARAAHSATLLPDGTVLIAGGCTEDSCETGEESAGAELFRPRDASFTRTDTMRAPRLGHAAVALPDGRVLLVGGWQGRSVTRSTELYDPVAGTFSAGPELRDPRAGAVVAALSDGTIFVAGGYDGNRPIATAELLDPFALTFRMTDSMGVARDSHVGANVEKDEVLVAGGHGPDGVLRSAEIYNGATGPGRPRVRWACRATSMLPRSSLAIAPDPRRLGRA